MYWSSLVVQQVKNAALSLLWRKFDPWPGELLCAMDTAKKERKKKKIMDSESEAWVVDLLPLQVIV